MSFAEELIHAAHRPPVQFRKTPEKIHCRNCGSLLEAFYPPHKNNCNKNVELRVINANADMYNVLTQVKRYISEMEDC